MERYVGIDLGTTNSIVSVANKTYRGDIESETLRVAQIDANGLNIIEQEDLPSVLYVEQGGDNYVGRYAKRMSSIYKQRVIKESKRHLGTGDKWVIDGKEYTPDKIASFFLSSLKREVEKYYNGEQVDGAVITIPANFHFQQQQETRNAGVLAGFAVDKIHLLPEPTAALIDFLNEEEKLDPDVRRLNVATGPKKLLVFDLGGGTCDVSILQVEETASRGLSITELSISQYTALGGRDFDRQVAQYLLMKYFTEKNIKLRDIQATHGEQVAASLVESFIDIAENAKKRFSAFVLTSGADYYADPAQFDARVYREPLPTHLPAELFAQVSITKKEYDEAIKSLLYKAFDKQNKNIEEPIRSALAEARVGELTVDDIDAVFLVGGMTYYPTVQNRIYELFNRRMKPFQSINPMISVSRGAAIYHQKLGQIKLGVANANTKLAGRQAGISTIETTVPVNVFIDVKGSTPVPLLEKGTLLPVEKEFHDKFYVSGVNSGVANVTTMKLELFTASSATAISTKRLKEATLQFSKHVKAGSPLVLRVTCDKERDVIVRAWLKDAPDEMITVNIGAKEYTPDEVKQMQAEHSRTMLEAATR